MEKLSVAIITKNNGKCIRRCLESLRWADEIVVLDGYSDDDTVAVCREFTDKVYQKNFESFPVERKYVLDKASNKWILSADADMEFPEEFRKEVQETLKAPSHDGYRFRGLTIFLGKPIRHCSWFDPRYLRLFNKEKGMYDLNYAVWDVFQVTTGNVGVLRSHFIHHQDESFIDYFGKIKRYSHLTAIEYQRKGVVVSHTNAAWCFIFKPLLVFLYKYIWKRGILDGIPGLIVCIDSAISYYSSYAALWDMQRSETNTSKNGGKP